ncbi:MAG: N-methyl-L-tryptophan oxidase [Chloroflexi bacterium]|nr:N-methyl-L-tryptophan oxidase [Chloroflexota bacterium]MCY3580983.1 N-methyl-L-tryptophan oxidase [Chloroflexota bacterium]MCY3716975.1 N-methyl-L-tryptophan oxidase [Chloroflexota bacterium]MDE2650159.1 N-methyl-L-tryptophan oxidase [Chloroflexota bacterium]MXV92034.1 N-methyl-L-tryptophan oxidase [Chloroflexota bacterium]
MTEHYDAIVIGLGGMGSAALYHLAKRGQKALGIDQFAIPHQRGSSHGLTRIIRLAYYEDLAYVPLLRRSYALWTELEREFGEQLFYQTGSIDMGPADSDVFRGSLESCIENDFPYQVLDSRALRARFPAYQMPAETMALYQPQGGLLVPERCITAHATLAQQHGAKLHTGERVLGWGILPDERVQVRSNQGNYLAEKLIICGGAWMAKLLPTLAGKAIPERQALIWLQPKQPDLFGLESFPVWNGQVEEGRYYGLPEFNPSGNTPGMKLGRYHHRGEICDPDTVDRAVHPEDEALLRTFAERYFPTGAGATLDMAICMFTNTADEHFVLDTLPDAPQVSVAAGFSGHGFKMASVVGEIMAEMALQGQSQQDIALFRLARL